MKKDVTCVYAWNMVWTGFHMSELPHIHVSTVTFWDWQTFDPAQRPGCIMYRLLTELKNILGNCFSLSVVTNNKGCRSQKKHMHAREMHLVFAL